MTNAELSLAVAKIMNLRYISHTQLCREYINNGLPCECGGAMNFNHTTDDALGKMALWCRSNLDLVPCATLLGKALDAKNPHRAIAEAIVEANE